MADHYAALAHEIWAVAQLAPGEGIADGVARVEALLRNPYSDEALGIVPEDGQEKGRE